MINGLQLTIRQAEFLQQIRSFNAEHLAPYSAEYDRSECLPRSFIEQLHRARLLCSTIPVEWGGGGWDILSYGLLHCELGSELASASAIVTVHDMLAHTLVAWGSNDQKHRWLPDLRSGHQQGCVAVSEDTAGSDLRAIETTAVRQDDHYVLSGVKRWITGGQYGTLFLVLAKLEGKPTAFVVEKERGNISVSPVHHMLGFRAAMLADIKFENCKVPATNILGRVNLGIEGPIQTALDLGRYCVACNSVGLAEACLRSSVSHASEHTQFGNHLKKHQLIAQMLADIATDIEAAKLLCWRAAYDRQIEHPRAVLSTLQAKYFCSKVAATAAANAVQILGARGCSENYPTARYYRDSKILEIIEGSSQIQQLLISRLVCQGLEHHPNKTPRQTANGVRKDANEFR